LGFMKEATGAYGGGLMVLSASLAFAAVLAWALGRRRTPAPA
jgi:hypothetical protein